jgi:hypothetical protein
MYACRLMPGAYLKAPSSGACGGPKKEEVQLTNDDFPILLVVGDFVSGPGKTIFAVFKIPR